MAQGAIGTGFPAGVRVGQLGSGAANPFQQGTTITYVERGTITVTPSAIGANTSGDTALTITNAATGDTVLMTPPATALTAGLVQGQAWVSAASTVQLRIANITAGSLTPASGTWEYVLIRS